MKAPNYPLDAEMLEAMFEVTRMSNEKMRAAMHDHLVLGDSQSTVAARYEYTRQQISVNANKLLDVIKPAFDRYAARVVRQRKLSATK
ncbi:hypothetical protein [Burkholderia arboris]|uniref:hypothetical protein n=1 Tax=Burkholderia arboris TaxID=488730 RepID=UPI001CF3EE01|nr:hypothetical protein [Burkholderia arboris]MCA8050716.1 hypothetical protein [Burkholderia arboris]CAJ6619520.1 Uncharacterised protein [Burkholderia pseudomallei]CAJ6713079.1 Uncharacterised protein [Burkholderia pseudomallei]HEP6431489.1 hypothetical protein [Burkholderia cenocepacia]